jgi:hypothetical protein
MCTSLTQVEREISKSPRCMALWLQVVKMDFFVELIAHKPPNGVKWLALGVFNQIRRARK